MQTFLPYPDFVRTASVLDDRRLGKQRVEGIQVVRALTRPTYGWRNHPAVLMWRGWEPALECYLDAICAEWSRRGYADTCRATIRQDLAEAGVGPAPSQATLSRRRRLPTWLGDEPVHRSHRGALLRKDPEWYGRFFDPSDEDEWDGYVWPVRSRSGAPATAGGTAVGGGGGRMAGVEP